MLYMALMIYPFYLNIMRQAISIAIWMIAYEFLKKRRFLPYTLLVLLAMTFHLSAVTFLLYPFLLLVPVNRKTLSIFVPATGVLSLFAVIFAKPLIALLRSIFAKYENYEEMSFDALYYYFAVFAVFAIYGVVRLYFTKAITDPANESAPPAARVAEGFDEQGFLTLMMLIGCIVAALMTQYGVMERIFNYFEVLFLLWIPSFLPPSITISPRKKLGYRPETLAIGACCLLYFVVILFFRSEQWYAALPYSFFWQA